MPPYEFLADRAVSVVADWAVEERRWSTPALLVVEQRLVAAATGRQVLAARRLPSMLRALPPVLGPERIAALADQARVRFHAAA